MSNWNALAEALAQEGARRAREARNQRRAEDAARPVGAEALALGITDYRRPPSHRVDAEDWAVWRLRWDGRCWVRTKRLAGNKSFSEALNSLMRLKGELGLERVEAYRTKPR